MAELLAPGYFPDDRMRNFMHPGEVVTLTCLPVKAPARCRQNPLAVLQAVTARTRDGVWLVLPLTSIAWPGRSAALSTGRRARADHMPGRELSTQGK